MEVPLGLSRVEKKPESAPLVLVLRGCPQPIRRTCSAEKRRKEPVMKRNARARPSERNAPRRRRCIKASRSRAKQASFSACCCLLCGTQTPRPKILRRSCVLPQNAFRAAPDRLAQLFFSFLFMVPVCCPRLQASFLSSLSMPSTSILGSFSLTMKRAVEIRSVTRTARTVIVIRPLRGCLVWLRIHAPLPLAPAYAMIPFLI